MDSAVGYPLLAPWQYESELCRLSMYEVLGGESSRVLVGAMVRGIVREMGGVSLGKRGSALVSIPRYTRWVVLVAGTI